MSYPINYPTPQGANIQIFKDPSTVCDWVKPQGASFVWFTLIGAGGGTDDNAGGGGSGAVTNFMGPAFLMPDILQVKVGKGASGVTGAATTQNTYIVYQQKDGTGYTLLTANGGTCSSTSTGIGGTASSSNYFSCMGFYQSVAGQNGGINVTASPTTFLSGSPYYLSATSTSNYGYGDIGNEKSGIFQMQPIIVGTFNKTGTSPYGGQASVGCGGSSTGYPGGDGLVVIITW